MGKLFASIASAGIALLLFRAFEILDCEHHTFLVVWMFVSVGGLSVVHFVFIFIIVPIRPRIGLLVTISAASACIVSEYLLYDVYRTAAVQLLMPMQQLYCSIFVTFMMHPSRKISSLPVVKAAKSVVGTGTSVLKTIDPFQKRQSETERQEASWWS